MSLPVDRNTSERREDAWLAPWAMRSSMSRGRRYPEEPDPLRTPFQRDRDRIVHCAAFRRLESKTQVFISRTGDHYRTRLTHSLEVAQVSRSVARALAMNEDLTEAVALAHDLGHTPFGHSGGDVLDELMREHGGFEHNFQSLRIVEHLEWRYPGIEGLNLSYEVRESIVKHKHPYEGAVFADYSPNEEPPLEARIVDICDGIAYNSHDLDDGLASGILTPEQVESVELWQVVSDRVRRRWPDIDGKLYRLKCVSEVINYLMHDLIASTAARLESSGIDSIEKVRAATEPLVALSAEAQRLERGLRSFLYKNFYTHYKVHRMRNRARVFIVGLFRAFVENKKLLPPRYQARVESEGLHRTVADYIAGMTDPYAQAEYQRLFHPFEGL